MFAFRFANVTGDLIIVLKQVFCCKSLETDGEVLVKSFSVLYVLPVTFMDSGVSAHMLLLVCWPTIAFLGAFGVLFISMRQNAKAHNRDGRLQAQQRHFLGATKLLLVGVLLLGAVFLIPDAGQAEHRSFFSVAQDSFWGHLFEWPAAWCSAKIIVLSVSGLLILEAILSLAMHTEHRIACTALLVLAVVPVLLGCFGFYQFVKAVF
jgi:hypothetical protein